VGRRQNWRRLGEKEEKREGSSSRKGEVPKKTEGQDSKPREEEDQFLLSKKKLGGK